MCQSLVQQFTFSSLGKLGTSGSEILPPGRLRVLRIREIEHWGWRDWWTGNKNIKTSKNIAKELVSKHIFSLSLSPAKRGRVGIS